MIYQLTNWTAKSAQQKNLLADMLADKSALTVAPIYMSMFVSADCFF